MLVPGLGNLGANRITSRQPMSSGATCSAGRQKKDWGRCWEGLVAMGVAFVIEFTPIPEPNLSHYHFANWLPLSTTPTQLTS